jgi:hypothetical protein
VSGHNKSSRAPQGQVINPAKRAAPVSAGPDAFMREHEMCDALLRMLIAHSRYGANTDADRLGLIEHVVVLLAREVGERVERIRGKDDARAYRRALARRAAS